MQRHADRRGGRSPLRRATIARRRQTDSTQNRKAGSAVRRSAYAVGARGLPMRRCQYHVIDLYRSIVRTTEVPRASA